jgi:drug/metabolite transporter (DMT)-like permease
VQLPWYVTALGAALVWGIHYPLIANALKKFSFASVLLLTALGIIAVAPFFYREIAADYFILKAMDWRTKAVFLLPAVTGLLGSALLFISIDSKNATLASLIEISYPVFVALFTYVLFRDVQINAGVLVGAALVFTGVGLIILHNP